MFCCISNRVPQEPVVSRSSGCLFERRLIEKFIDENGRCPITGEALTRADLLPLRPSPSAATASAASGLGCSSVPSLLERLHSEWDAAMMEQFTLRQRVAQMQQELAHALRQYEAACGVIVTLTKECEELKRVSGDGAASTHRSNGHQVAEEAEEEGNGVSLPESVVAAISNTEAELRRQRKQRKAASSSSALPSAEEVSKYSETHRFALNKGGVLCVTSCDRSGNVYASGTGVDHAVVCYSAKQQRVMSTGLGHTKAVHTLTTMPQDEIVVSASEDATVKVWRSSAEEDSEQNQTLLCARTMQFGNGVAAMARYLIAGRFAFTSSADSCLSLSDVERGEHVAVTGPRGGTPLRGADSSDCFRTPTVAAEVHPYGSLAAIATSAGELVLWNVRQMSVDTLVSLPSSQTTSAHAVSLSFSPDCLTLATGMSDGQVYVWDLRKIESPVATLSATAAAPPACVAYDGATGHYLAVGGEAVRVFNSSLLHGESGGNAALLSTLEVGSKPVRHVCWTRGTFSVCSGSLDGIVKIFGSA